MERVTTRAGRARASAGALSRLFKVLVVGGIALGAGCATTKGGDKGKPDDGPPSQPEQPSGVRGW
ncbi:MAG TPA: hypothetical protein VML50_08955 [Anaeromyxobacter sp.]|nr:hypothetical protein [Anaeromyxobacter sp.]